MSRSMEENVIRYTVVVMARLEGVSRVFEIPKGYRTVLQFTFRNLLTLFASDKNEKEWAKTRFSDKHQLDELSRVMVQLIWSVLKMGHFVNSLRRNNALTPINWLDSATDYDKRRTHAQESASGPQDIYSEYDLTEYRPS